MGSAFGINGINASQNLALIIKVIENGLINLKSKKFGTIAHHYAAAGIFKGRKKLYTKLLIKRTYIQ